MIGIASISDVVKDDHREIEDAYDRIRKTNDLVMQAHYQAALIWTLARQCISEELIIFPALEAFVKDGKIIAQKNRQEHETIKEHVMLLEATEPADGSFLHKLENLMEHVKQHVSFEERNDLVALEAGLRASESEELACEYRRMRKMIWVREGADDGIEKAFESAAALFATPMEELGDFFDKLPRD